MNSIPIEPVSVYNNGATREVTQFAIVRVDYTGDGTGASAISILLDADNAQCGGSAVYATQEQCDKWFDDDSFYRVLAVNAGLTPIEPPVGEKAAALELLKVELQSQIEGAK